LQFTAEYQPALKRGVEMRIIFLIAVGLGTLTANASECTFGQVSGAQLISASSTEKEVYSFTIIENNQNETYTYVLNSFKNLSVPWLTALSGEGMIGEFNLYYKRFNIVYLRTPPTARVLTPNSQIVIRDLICK
jgi:hypothetical protein